MKHQNILFLLIILVAVAISTSFLFNQDLGEIEDIGLIDSNSDNINQSTETPNEPNTIPEDTAESNDTTDSNTSSSKITYTIVDTGQEYCYDDKKQISAPQKGEPYYGQDAQYIGVQMAYQDNGDGTVTDLSTGLMWQKTLGEKLTYEEALSSAESFSLAGYDDWRLPTIKELYSLIDFSGSTGRDAETSVPYINTDYFDFYYGDTTSERFIDAQYCSSTVYVGTTMNGDKTVFGVNFADGRIKGYGITMRGGSEKTFYVMYVRGNPDYGVNSYTEIGEDIILDQATGLMWSKFDSEEGMNWEEALEWVQLKNEMNYLGYSDWQLPNAKELQSIVDYTRSPSTTGSASIDPVFDVTQIIDEGGDVNYPFYWTSTTHLDGPDAGFAIYVAFGEALGYMEMPLGSGNYGLMDVHGAGAQRSDPKTGSADDYPNGHGPQGDVVRVENYVRLIRDSTELYINQVQEVKTTENQYNIQQAVSDRAQENTIAFDALAFFTGNTCADSFIPPGKVADFFGFQYLRDNTPDGMGHNTDFVTNCANNVLYILNEDQKQQMIDLARTQVDLVNEYASERYPLLVAFRRQLEGDIPVGSRGLSKEAVIVYSENLYLVDAEISMQRANLFGDIIRSLDIDQVAFLNSMVEVGFDFWEPKADQIDKTSLTHDKHVLVMTFASEMFGWYAGSIEADTYFCPERHGTYFGSFYMKDAPAIGQPGYTIDETITGNKGEELLTLLTEPQSKQITDLVDIQKENLNGIVDCREAISSELRNYITQDGIDEDLVLSLAKEYGARDGENVYYYAMHFSEVMNTLTDEQMDSLMELRGLEDYQCDEGTIYLYSEKIIRPEIEDSDFLFARAAGQ